MSAMQWVTSRGQSAVGNINVFNRTFLSNTIKKEQHCPSLLPFEA
ncbi:hypothetical protein [Aggregatibacter segnis]|nr:hypothetical protein [Aggregatibacter segnis]